MECTAIELLSNTSPHLSETLRAHARPLSCLCTIISSLPFTTCFLLFSEACMVHKSTPPHCRPLLFSPVPLRAHFPWTGLQGQHLFPCIHCGSSVPPSSDGKAVRSVQEGRAETTKHRRKSGKGRHTGSALARFLCGLVLSKWRQVSVTGASLAGYDVSFMDAGFAFFSLYQDSSRGELYLHLPVLLKN